MLVRNGMRTVQLIGVPEPGMAVPDADAVVVALKSRTAPVAEAVAQSLAAQRWLAGQGARQYPVQVLLDLRQHGRGQYRPGRRRAAGRAAGADFTIACPAFPETGRTIFKGHLFVGDLLLSDTHMRHHPLTPMTDASLVRVLQRQTAPQVGLVPFDVVRRGPEAIRARFAELRQAGCAYAVTDVLEDEDLRRLGAACADMALLTGGSGIAMGLPENFRAQRTARGRGAADACRRSPAARWSWPAPARRRRWSRWRRWRRRAPPCGSIPRQLAAGWRPARPLPGRVDRMADGPVLIYASAPPEEVRPSRAGSAAIVPAAWSSTRWPRSPTALVAAGVRRLVVAGGETSGAVVQALGVQGLRDRADDRPRRAGDGLDRRRAAAGAGAEIRQFRRPRFLPQRSRSCRADLEFRDRLGDRRRFGGTCEYHGMAREAGLDQYEQAFRDNDVDAQVLPS